MHTRFSVLLNVVVAVLLDEFISSVTRSNEEAAALLKLEHDLSKVTGVLDPLTKSLTIFDDDAHLTSS